MWKFRLAVFTACGAFALTGAAGALGASGGDSNAGDVWADNVGQPAGPGHEMDPHLACQDINLWGDKLADSSGTYTIDGWPPSGSKEVDYSSSWSYNQSQGGDQVISVINVQQLIATAQANGDQPAAQGYHFKLDLSQDPQKHKTFWINCQPPSSSGGSSGSQCSGSSSGSNGSMSGGCTSTCSGSSSSSNGSMSGGCTSGSSTCTCQSGSTQSGSTQGTTQTASSPAPSSPSSSSPSGSVKATHVHRHRRHHARRHTRKHRRLVRPHRRHHAKRDSVKAVSVAAPAFTG